MDGWLTTERTAATARANRTRRRPSGVGASIDSIVDGRLARNGEEVASRVSKLGSKVWDWDWNSAPDDRRDGRTTPDATRRDSKWVRARRETTANTTTEV